MLSVSSAATLQFLIAGSLDATLALESQAAGAGYAIYWTRDQDNKAVVASTINAPAGSLGDMALAMTPK